MWNIKSKLVIASLVSGGLLFVAVARPGHAFAMSDSSSTATATVPATSASTDQTSPDPSTDSTATTAPPPTDPSDSTVAGGSTATQNDDSTVDSSSQSTTTPTDGQSTGTGSTDTDTEQNTNNTNTDNSVTGTAQSGDATVKDSPQGGDATTGDASDTTTLVNSSSSSVSNGMQTFTYNVNGDQNGDIVLDLNSILSGAGTPPDNDNSDTTTVTDQNNTTVNNNVNLSATSGDATVKDSPQGGDATTGDALTEADIVNLLSSLVCDGQSFVGTININGDLNGNILIPESLINELLNPTQQASTSGDSTATNNTTINNQVSLNATSGNASETSNGQGGSATSGNATTTLQMYNLINDNIVGGNVLLVFVNVVGQWYGLLLNAPTGTTTAALGGGIAQDVSTASDATATNNITINNIVNLCSTTGNATVEDNGVGGNATSGNAIAIADIANVVNSQINLSGWLGILIINVFGTWDGNLALQMPVTSDSGSVQHTSTPHTAAADSSQSGSSNGSGVAYNFYTAATTQASSIVTTADREVLGVSTGNGASVSNVANLAAKPASVSARKANYTDLIIGLVLVIGSAVTLTVSNSRAQKRGKKG